MWNLTRPRCVLILLDCTLNSPSRNTGLNCVVTRLTFLRTCRYLGVSNDVSHIRRRKKCDVPVILPESYSFLGPLKWVVTDISTVILCIYGIAEMENFFVYGSFTDSATSYSCFSQRQCGLQQLFFRRDPSSVDIYPLCPRFNWLLCSWRNDLTESNSVLNNRCHLKNDYKVPWSSTTKWREKKSIWMCRFSIS